MKPPSRLREANQALRMLSACNQAIVRSTDERRLMREICRVAVEVGGYRMAWVGIPLEDAKKSIRPLVSRGFEAGYLESIRLTWADAPRGSGPTSRAIRTGVPQVCSDFRTDPRLAIWKKDAQRRGYRSSIALPIKHEGQVLGALSIYSSRPRAFGRRKREVLVQLTDDLAIGMITLRARAKLKALAVELTVVEQRERRRVAEVLHDELQQLLVGAQLALGQLERERRGRRHEVARKVRHIIDESIACSRELTQELSPPLLSDGGLPAALGWLADEMRERHGLIVRLRAPRGCEPATEAARTLLYRCVRELLFNAVKHARVDEARVEVRRVGGRIRVTVSDDGVGFHTTPVSGARGKSGFGLASIRDRLALLGGGLRIESAPGEGSRFTLWVGAS